MLENGLPAAIQRDRHDVKAAGPSPKPLASEVRIGNTQEVLLLSGAHRLGGKTESQGAPAFDLDEHDRASISGDDVNFLSQQANIAIQDYITFGLQMGSGEFLEGVAIESATRQ
jgi:hypothetical protein